MCWAPMMAGDGDDLPVSALPMDGTYPTGTSKWEKRNLAREIPVWDEELCIQCGKCVLVCPHAVIRSKLAERELLASAPDDIQIVGGALDGTGTFAICAARPPPRIARAAVFVSRSARRKSKSGTPKRKPSICRCRLPLREQEKRNWDFFLEFAGARSPRSERHSVKDAAAAAVVRVPGRMRGLRRDALHQVAHATFRRPVGDRERHGLLLHLRRESAHHALHDKSRGPRSGLGEFAV